MNAEVYQALSDLVDIFNNCTANGQEVFCFELIKDIAEGKIKKESITEEKKIIARKQLDESMEWLQSLGVKTKYQQELKEFIE